MPAVVYVHGMASSSRASRCCMSTGRLRCALECDWRVTPRASPGSLATPGFCRDLFVRRGALGVGDPWLTAEDATEFDRELLLAWWQAAETDPDVVDPGARILVRAPGGVQAGRWALTSSGVLKLVDRVMLFDVYQVHRYLTEPQLRQAISGADDGYGS
jgi:hypothetical protein